MKKILFILLITSIITSCCSITQKNEIKIKLSHHCKYLHTITMTESDAQKIYNHLKNIDIRNRKLSKKYGLIRWSNEENLNGYAITATDGSKEFTGFLYNNLPFEIDTYNFKNIITDDSKKLLINLIPAWKNKK